MPRVRVYLRQDLFSLPGELAHVPKGAAVLEGSYVEVNPFGVRVDVQVWRDEKGRALEGASCDLLVPAVKIDHVLFL